MTALPSIALAAALALAVCWMAGGLVLRALDARPGIVPERAIPALLIVPPLFAAALSAAFALVPVRHGDDAHPGLGGDAGAGALLPFTLPLAFILVLRAVRRLGLGISALRGGEPRVRATTRFPLDGGSVRLALARLGEPNARAAAWPVAHVVVDEAWWSELPAAERRIVVAHEAAHLRRRDPWIAFAACAASALLPDRVWGLWFSRWRSWAERAADLGAARAHGDGLDVADLLVRQQRRLARESRAPLAFGHPGSIEARVRALAFGTTPPDALRPDLGWGAALLAGAAVALPLLGSGPLHRAIEFVLLAAH